MPLKGQVPGEQQRVGLMKLDLVTQLYCAVTNLPPAQRGLIRDQSMQMRSP